MGGLSDVLVNVGNHTNKGMTVRVDRKRTVWKYMVFLAIIKKYIVAFTVFYISLRGKIFLWLYQPEKYSIILL